MKITGARAFALCILAASPARAEDPPEGPESTVFQAIPSQTGTPVEIATKYLEVSPEAALEIFGAWPSPAPSVLPPSETEQLFRRLDQRQDAELLSAPRVTTKAKHKAAVKIVRQVSFPTEFEPPGTVPATATTPLIRKPPIPSQFESRDVGLTIEIEPETTPDGRIRAAFRAGMVELLGFINFGASRTRRGPAPADALDEVLVPADDTGRSTGPVINQPVFRTREIETTVVLPRGYTVVLGGLARTSGQKLIDSLELKPEAASAPPKRRLFYVFVTMHVPDYAPKTAQAATTTSVPTPRPAAGLPHGRPVSGQPGFITSPWAPDDGHVDVRGFPSGTEVRCPYTGKLFLVP